MKDNLIIIGGMLVIVSVFSAIVIGLTFVPWDLVIKYPRETILIVDIPLFIVGLVFIGTGCEMDSKR
jgi:hypothetical protein